MFIDYFLNKAEEISVPLDIRESLCSRFRFEANKCSDCVISCPFGAIALEESMTIDIKKCEGCLLCASVCKSEAISASVSLRTFEKLKQKHQQILIGCTKADIIHHYRKACIGWLSEEILVYLSKVFRKGVTIDISGCQKCVNKPAYEYVVKNVKRLQEKIGDLNIYLLEDSEKLVNSAKVSNRREFFRLLSNTAGKEMNLYLNSSEEKPMYYCDKNLPLKRNAILALMNDEDCSEIYYKDYLYNIYITANCTNCLECIAVCPTGALLEGDDQKVKTDNNKCTMCKLCVEFCEENSIILSKKGNNRENLPYVMNR